MWGHQFHIFSEGRQMVGLSFRWDRSGPHREAERTASQSCEISQCGAKGGLWNRLPGDLKARRDLHLSETVKSSELSSQQGVERRSSHLATVLYPQIHVSFLCRASLIDADPTWWVLPPRPTQKGWPTDLGVRFRSLLVLQMRDSQASLPNFQCLGL